MTAVNRGAATKPALCSLMIASVVILAGCSHQGSASQVVASVGGDEITETQVNHAMERQPNVRPDQVDAVARRVVTGLVEQQIVLQKAHDLKLDRDDRVMENIEAMKRQLIATAYIERIAEGAAKPTPKDVQDYFDAHPAQFSQRRSYVFQELAIDATPEQSRDIQAQLGTLKSADEIAAYLKSKQIVSRSSQTTLTPENMQPQMVQRVSTLKPGQGLIVPAPTGPHVLLLLAANDAPMTLEQASGAISAYLYTQNKRQAVDKELTSLRSGVKVAYFGKYADLGASAPAMAAPASAGTVSNSARPQ